MIRASLYEGLALFQVTEKLLPEEVMAAMNRFYALHAVRDALWDINNASLDSFNADRFVDVASTGHTHQHKRGDVPRTVAVVPSETDRILLKAYVARTSALTATEFRTFTNLKEGFTFLDRLDAYEGYPKIADENVLFTL